MLTRGEFDTFVPSSSLITWEVQAWFTFTYIYFSYLNSMDRIHEGIIRLANVGGALEDHVGPGQLAGRGVSWAVTWQDAPPFLPLLPLWTQTNCFPCTHTEDTPSPAVTKEWVSRTAVWFSISTCRRRLQRYLVCAGSQLHYCFSFLLCLTWALKVLGFIAFWVLCFFCESLAEASWNK